MYKAINITGPVSRKAGGLYESVRHLCQSLESIDLDVRVFGVTDEFSKEDIKAWAPVEVSAFRPFLHKQFGYSWRFYEAVKNYHPDIVHSHGLWVYSSVVTTRLHRKFGTPYLISPHGMLDPWAVANSRLKKRIAHAFFESAHLRGAACIRALCESELQSIRAYGLNNPVAVIPNGIDLPEESKGNKARPPWEGFIEPGCKVLFFLSRIHPKKGLVNLLRAWKQTLHTPHSTLNSPWVLAIAGWDQKGHEDELKGLATELGIPWTEVGGRNAERRVQRPGNPQPNPSLLFLGPQFGEAKAACYRACDAFILPSFSEGLPMVVLEAWAYGKPVLMTPECNLPIGFEVDAARRINAETISIAGGLADFFAEPESARREMGEQGLALVKRHFTWQTIALQMRAVYDWILKGGSPPECVRFASK